MRYLSPNPIRTARKRINMTGEQLAEELNKMTGRHLTKAEISRWESSKHKPNQTTIFQLAKILKQNPIQFYNEVINHYAGWRTVFKGDKACNE